MLTVGLDAHQGLYVICVLDEKGQVIKERQIRGRWRKLVEVLEELPKPLQICFEASCGTGHLHDQLTPIADRVVVAHPGKLRLISRSKRKTDRIDAKKLAMLLLVNMVPTVYVPSVDVRAWRQFIEYRHRTVAERTRTKNALRTLLRSYGITPPSRSRLWTRKGLAWLADVELPNQQAILQRLLLLDALESCERRIKQIEDALAEVATQHPAVTLLQTIPGVGIRTAEAIVAYIDDPHRFRRNRRVGSYFGMVPSQDQSSGVNRLGRITRQGPATARKLLTEAAWQGIRRSDRIRAFYDRIHREDPKRKKTACARNGRTTKKPIVR